MPGPPPDLKSERSKRRGLTVLGVSGSKVTRPPAPAGILAPVRVAWDVFWDSPLAQHTISTDILGLRRLFRLYDQRERYLREGAQETLKVGSAGQMVLNPLLKEVDALDAKILALEDRFGLSPMARLKLQVTLGDATRSLKDINAALGQDNRPVEEADDPRRVGLG